MKDANSAGSLYWADYDSALMLAAYGGNGQTQLPANPPVVFLHYDYMLSTDPALPHSHEPNEGSIDLVVEAYRRHGITLLIDPEHTVIPEHQVLRFYGRTCGYQDEVNFYNLKTQYFHPKGNLPCTT